MTVRNHSYCTAIVSAAGNVIYCIPSERGYLLVKHGTYCIVSVYCLWVIYYSTWLNYSTVLSLQNRDYVSTCRWVKAEQLFFIYTSVKRSLEIKIQQPWGTFKIHGGTTGYYLRRHINNLVEITSFVQGFPLTLLKSYCSANHKSLNFSFPIYVSNFLTT